MFTFFTFSASCQVLTKQEYSGTRNAVPSILYHALGLLEGVQVTLGPVSSRVVKGIMIFIITIFLRDLNSKLGKDNIYNRFRLIDFAAEHDIVVGLLFHMSVIIQEIFFQHYVESSEESMSTRTTNSL